MRRGIAIAVIWFLFLVADVVAGLAFPFIALFGLRYERARNRASHIGRAMNKLAAGLVFGDGTKSISAQCGLSRCAACKRLCAVLEWGLKDPKHCEKEAAQ